MGKTSDKGEPVGWVTIKGVHFPKWADGTIGWQQGEEHIDSKTTTKEAKKLSEDKRTIRQKNAEAMGLDYNKVNADLVKEYEGKKNEYDSLFEGDKKDELGKWIKSHEKAYNEAKLSAKGVKGKPKNDEDLWLNHVTPEEREKVFKSLSNEYIKNAVIDNRLHGEKMESVLGKLYKALQTGHPIRQLPKNVRNLKKGEYFTKKDLSDPKEVQVWVRGEYIPSAKAYSCYKYSDVNQETLLKSNAEVWTDFYF